MIPGISGLPAGMSYTATGGGGSGSFAPGQIVDLYAWWDPGSGMALTGSNVDGWTDRVSGIHFTPSATFVPTYAATGLNSLPVVQNDGGGGSAFLAAPYSDTGSDHSVVFLTRMADSGSSNGRLLSFGNLAAADDYQIAGSFAFKRENSTTTAQSVRNSAYRNQVVGYDTWFIGALVFDGTNGALYINGMQVGSSFASTGSFNINQLSLWVSTKSSLASDFGTGKFADILTIKRAFTSTEREQLEGWLAHRYALTSLLPGGHPYKTNAP